MSFQNDVESIQDQLRRGLVNADQANVLMVQCQGVRLVTSRLPFDVRRALNAAVKAGELGHLKKDGHKPEAYFHKNAGGTAKAARRQHEQAVYAALLSVCARSELSV